MRWLRTRGLDVVQCADPGGTPIGDLLRAILLEHRGHMSLPCEALLFMASRAQLVAEVIRPALAAGKAVVCDRFLLANVVYQGYAGGLDPQKLWDLGLLATGGLEPDVTFVLDLPLEIAQAVVWLCSDEARSFRGSSARSSARRTRWSASSSPRRRSSNPSAPHRASNA